MSSHDDDDERIVLTPEQYNAYIKHQEEAFEFVRRHLTAMLDHMQTGGTAREYLDTLVSGELESDMDKVNRALYICDTIKEAGINLFAGISHSAHRNEEVMATLEERRSNPLVEQLRAIGFNVVMIDENTDFSQMPPLGESGNVH